MKRILIAAIQSGLVFLLAFGTVHAVSIIYPGGGGTGWGYPGGIQAHSVLIGNGINPLSTTTPGTSGWVFTSNGPSSDPTFQPSTGGSGTGLATTSPIASSNLLVYSSVGAGSAYGIATSTLTASSPLTGSFTQIGTGGALGCQTASGSQAGCLSSADWTTFNGKLSSAITALGPLGQTQTGATQTLATSTDSTTGLTSGITITATGNVQTFKPTLSGFLNPGFGGTGTSTLPGYGKVLVGNLAGTGYDYVATSTFGSGSASLTGTQGQVAYFSGTNTAVGTSTLFITQPGAIGINTLAPSAQLDVAGTTTTSAAQALDIWNSANTNLLRVRNDGFVGISTTSPATQLNVHGNVAVDNMAGSLGYSYFGLPIANGGAPTIQDNFLVASTSFSGALRNASFTAMLNGGTGGNIPIQALNAVAVVNSGTLGNITSTGTGGSPRAGRYIATNNLSGFNVNTQSALTLSNGISGVLASTTNAIDLNLENPTIAAGNVVTNFYGVLAKGAAVTGTLTNRYGVYVENEVGGTNRYAFYNAGKTDLNYFAGNTGIGTTSPFAKLSVMGQDTDTNLDLFAVGSSTSAATSTFILIDNTGSVYFPLLGTPAGTFLAVDPNGKLIATTTPSGGSGTVTSVGLSDANSTLTIGGTPVTSSGTITVTLNLANPNIWTGLQTFANATSTLLSSTYASSTRAFFGTLSIPSLGVPAGTFLAADPTGKIIATTTPSGGAVSSVSNSDGTLTISPTTGAVVASLALGHANTWTVGQSVNPGTLGGTYYPGLSLNENNNSSTNWSPAVVFQGYQATNACGGFVNSSVWSISNKTSVADPGNGNYSNLAFDSTTQTCSSVTSTTTVLTLLDNQFTRSVGIATTSPFATLAIHALDGSKNKFVFAIGSSTASATTTLLSVSNVGATNIAASGFVRAIKSFVTMGSGNGDGYGIDAESLGSTALNTGNSYGIMASSTQTGNGNIAYGGYFQANGDNNAIKYSIYANQLGTTNAYAVYSALGTNYFAGLTGIGTTSPFASLSIQSNSSTIWPFAISTTTGKMIQWTNAKGEQYSGGDVPVAGTCGSGPTFSSGSNNSTGRVHAGTGVITSCSFNFADGGWTDTSNPPACTASVEGNVSTGIEASTTATNVTFTSTGTIGGSFFTYQCNGF